MKGTEVYSIQVPTDLAEKGGHFIELRKEISNTRVLKPTGQKLVNEIRMRLPELDALAIVASGEGTTIITPISGRKDPNSKGIMGKFKSAFEATLGPDFAVSADQRELASVR